MDKVMVSTKQAEKLGHNALQGQTEELIDCRNRRY